MCARNLNCDVNFKFSRPGNEPPGGPTEIVPVMSGSRLGPGVTVGLGVNLLTPSPTVQLIG
jgi:hypothetical protein